MKKLLLLLLLVGFSAVGADKPKTEFDKDGNILVRINGADKPIKTSVYGLEGIAESGLGIVVEDYSKIDKTFNKKAIENQVELRLRQAGIKVGGNDVYLYINALPYHNFMRLSIQANRTVTFEANGKTYEKFGATVWEEGGIFGKSLLREQINKGIDAFLLDYLKANPKKTEP